MWPLEFSMGQGCGSQHHHPTSEGTDAEDGCWGQEGNTGQEMKRWGLKVEVRGEVLTGTSLASQHQPDHCSQGCEQGFLSNLRGFTLRSLSLP